MNVSYLVRKHVYANSVFGSEDRAPLITVDGIHWVSMSSVPEYPITTDASLFDGVDHRKQFREKYGIAEGYAIEVKGNMRHFMNFPENPFGYTRMGEIVFGGYIPNVVATLYPIHDVIKTYSIEEYFEMHGVVK